MVVDKVRCLLPFRECASRHRHVAIIVNFFTPSPSSLPNIAIANMSDPVAQKSGFLKTYMSNHPDTLVAYAKYFGKVAESISSAEMTAIDSNVSARFLAQDSS